MNDAKLKWRYFQSQTPTHNIVNMYGDEEIGFANTFWKSWPYIEKKCDRCCITNSSTGTVLHFK